MSIKFSHIEEAHERIKPHIHRTPIMQSQEINKLLGCELYFKAENLQKLGAFKARGGCNAVFSMDAKSLAKGVITHSSGNHGAALAWAAALRGANCTVVMPENAPLVKNRRFVAMAPRSSNVSPLWLIARPLLQQRCRSLAAP